MVRGRVVPPVGFVVTNLTKQSKNVVKFHNGRGTAELVAPPSSGSKRARTPEMDEAFLPHVQGQPDASATVRLGLSPRQLPAAISNAVKVVVDDQVKYTDWSQRDANQAELTLRLLFQLPAGECLTPR